MSDNDFQHYLKRCREEQAKAGLKTESPDHCPLLVAEHELVKAKHVLCDTMQPLTGIETDVVTGQLDNYKKYVDLTLRLLAPVVDAKI